MRNFVLDGEGGNVGREQLIWLGVGLTLLAGFAQFLIEFSFENASSVALALISWPVALSTFLSKDGFGQAPLPSLVLVGFWATQMIFPVVATALECLPVTHNLNVPGQVFLHNGLIFTVLVLAWLIYHRIFLHGGLLSNSARHYLCKIGIYEVPSSGHLYFLGTVGLSAMFYIQFFLPSIGVEASGTAQKSIQGLIPMAYAPFLLFFGRLYGGQIELKKHLPILCGFTVCLLIVAIGHNSRAAFMNAALFGVLAFASGVMVGVYKKRLLGMRVMIVGILSIYLLTGPIVDLATAMVLVRGARDNVARDDLVGLTWQAFQDKERIAAFREKEQGQLSFGRWDERYVTNPLLSRFCNLKFADLSLDLSLSATDEARTDFKEFSFQRLLATYPTPVVGFLGLNVDKRAVMSGSYGDYLFTVAGSGPGRGLGGFKRGHIAGTGMTAFGWWYLILLGAGALISFILIGWLQPSQGNIDESPKFTALSLLYLTPFFMMLPCESVIMIGSFLIRGWWEMIFLYAVLWLFFVTLFNQRKAV